MHAHGLARVETVIDAAAATYPDRVAIIHGERRWTYAALRAEMDRRAALLAAAVPAGEVVVTNCLLTDDVGITFCACCRADIALLYLSPRLSDAEVAALSDRARACLVLTEDGAPHPALPSLPALPISLPGAASKEAQAAAAARAAAATADGVAFVQITSGTTGTAPKLVPMPHRQITSFLPPPGALGAVDAVYYIPPPNPFIAFVLGIGGTMVLSHAMNPAQMEAEMAETGATAIWTVPPILRLLAEQGDPPPPDLRLRAVRTGSMSLPPEIGGRIEARYGARLIVTYGSTEMTMLIETPPEGMPAGSIGKPVSGIEIRLVDEEGRDVPTGEVGHLIARMPGMVTGYLDDPLATARSFVNGWFRTGDLARRDADGYYYLVGRATLRINVGGNKVLPEEVEAVLAQHPAVRDAAVFARADAGRGEVVWAAIIPRGTPPTAQELRHFCLERLAGYKVPRGFDFYDELPRSQLGKVLRAHLTSGPP